MSCPIILELSFIHCSIHLLESNIVLHLLVRGCQLGWALEHFKSLTSEHWKNILCWYYRQPFTLFAAFGQILNISHDPFCCKRIMFKALFTNAPICFLPSWRRCVLVEHNTLSLCVPKNVMLVFCSHFVLLPSFFRVPSFFCGF